MDRRRFLRAAAAAGIPVALAGCTGDGDDGGDGDATPTATDEPMDTPTATEEPTPTATDEPMDTPTATEEPTDTPTDSPTATEEPTPTPTATPEPDKRITVAPDGRLRFDPDSFTISAGDAVLWEWDGSGHNIKPDGIPADADWSGTPGENLKTYGSGYTYIRTFDVTGTYKYKCIPHQSNGMRASFTVE